MKIRDFIFFLVGVVATIAIGYLWFQYIVIIARLERLEAFLTMAAR